MHMDVCMFVCMYDVCMFVYAYICITKDLLAWLTQLDLGCLVVIVHCYRGRELESSKQDRP